MDYIYKVVFHLDDEKKGKNALNNAKNLLEDIEIGNKKLEIEILSNSTGIKTFKKNNDQEEQIKELQNMGVKIAICNNTIKSLNLGKESFIEGVNIVPSGVGELTKKQSEGWAYIKV